MTPIITLRKLFLAALFAAAGPFGTDAIAAGPSAGILPGPRYRTVVVYQTITKPFYTFVTKYDRFGFPHRIPVVTVRSFRIPVVKHIPVVY